MELFPYQQRVLRTVASGRCGERKYRDRTPIKAANRQPLR